LRLVVDAGRAGAVVAKCRIDGEPGHPYST
jgi:hypothetical protein